jgi:Kef-type K+ transport system membrane component KefB/nucleotide-binding universal stress UspA family protein
MGLPLLLADISGPFLGLEVQHSLTRLVSRSVENQVLLLLVQIALILGLSRVMGMLFARLRQPQVIGEMVAGIMLGPSVLGIISHPTYQTLFPKAGGSLELLNILSQLGVIFFLFLVGLEFEFELVSHRGRSTVLTALSSIVVPFVLGMGVALFLASRGLFGDAPRLPAALFIGAAMSVTAFPVLARILTERNLQKTKLGTSAIAAAAINDVAAWIILAFVVAIAHSATSAAAHDKTQVVRTIALSGAFAAAMFLLVRPFLRRLQAIYDREGRLSQNVMAAVFLLILACAWATEQIGIHAMFGAFLLGVVMPKGTQFIRHVIDKLEDFTVVFLLPIFFAYTGLKTDLGLLHAPSLWFYAILILGAACVGKFGGAATVAKAFGATWREASAIGVLMNTRGLVELVILTVGLQFGVITDKVFAMMVIMALVTTFMTTPLLYWIFPRRLLEAEAQAAGPSPEKAKPFTVVIPVANPQSGRPLLEMASLLAGAGQRRILALHLRQPIDRAEFRSGLRDAQPDNDSLLNLLVSQAREKKIPVEPISFYSSDVARDIAQTARDRQADLVLIGFHKPVFSRALLGGTVHRVMTATPADVAVFVDRDLNSVQRVLVPFLGSRHDRLAMELAGRLARSAKAQVTVLHVTPPKQSQPVLNAKEAVDRVFNDPTQPLPVQMRVVESDDPAGTVIDQSQHFDLVVIGVAEEWGLESHLFGWRSERIAAGAPTSLLIVRRFARLDAGEHSPEAQAKPSSSPPRPRVDLRQHRPDNNAARSTGFQPVQSDQRLQ